MTVSLSVSDGAQATLSEASLEFTGANWQLPQSVIVTATDDELAETPVHSVTIDVSSASLDANYADGTVTYLPGSSITFNIYDNEDSGVSVAGLPLYAEEGGST